MLIEIGSTARLRRQLTVLAATSVVAASVAACAAEFRPSSTGNAGRFTQADVETIAGAPSAASAELVLGDVGPDMEYVVTGSSYEALDMVLRTSPITHSVSIDDERRREDLTRQLYAGLDVAALRFHDAVGTGRGPGPVTAPGGFSFTVIAAAYTDSEAAHDAVPAFLAAYETWGFGAGMEDWSHGDESAAFRYGPMPIPHGRCFILGAIDGCEQGLRLFRVNNLVVTVVAEGGGAISTDEVIAIIDRAVADVEP